MLRGVWWTIRRSSPALRRVAQSVWRRGAYGGDDVGALANSVKENEI